MSTMRCGTCLRDFAPEEFFEHGCPPADARSRVDYDSRVRAIEDATRLMHDMRQPAPERHLSSTFTHVKTSASQLDRFDVVELARFLLNIEDELAEVHPGPCSERSQPVMDAYPEPCNLLAGHDGDHVAVSGMRWGAA